MILPLSISSITPSKLLTLFLKSFLFEISIEEAFMMPTISSFISSSSSFAASKVMMDFKIIPLFSSKLTSELALSFFISTIFP